MSESGHKSCSPEFVGFPRNDILRHSQTASSRFYIVMRGYRTAIFADEELARAQIHGFSNHSWKMEKTKERALEVWRRFCLKHHHHEEDDDEDAPPPPPSRSPSPEAPHPASTMSSSSSVSDSLGTPMTPYLLKVPAGYEMMWREVHATHPQSRSMPSTPRKARPQTAARAPQSVKKEASSQRANTPVAAEDVHPFETLDPTVAFSRMGSGASRKADEKFWGISGVSYIFGNRLEAVNRVLELEMVSAKLLGTTNLRKLSAFIARTHPGSAATPSNFAATPSNFRRSIGQPRELLSAEDFNAVALTLFAPPLSTVNLGQPWARI
ncbi:hypothetical protein B0H15DRAFT_957599 [Mycena belliarum]|uniref:Uncharacterized protein n=1 Tax=Mycena belliarum TaxID=1033014 RepID=A0AAD6XIB0_9AGAR|nr:hypothetical protein B0H15DRAFT_957599 [Mycena belliae]